MVKSRVETPGRDYKLLQHRASPPNVGSSSCRAGVGVEWGGGVWGRGRALGCRCSPPVCKWGDDQPRRVAQVLVGIFDLGVTDVGEAVFLFLVPAVSKLRLPGEGLRALHLQQEPKSLGSRPFRGASPLSQSVHDSFNTPGRGLLQIGAFRVGGWPRQ